MVNASKTKRLQRTDISADVAVSILSTVVVVHLVLKVVLQYGARLVTQPVVRPCETPNRVDTCDQHKHEHIHER